MAQLCIYLDDETMQILQDQSRQKKMSLSKCAAADIRESASKGGWPAYFKDLYGSVKDPTFERPDQGDPSLDDNPSLMFA